MTPLSAQTNLRKNIAQYEEFKKITTKVTQRLTKVVNTKAFNFKRCFVNISFEIFFKI